MNLAGLRIGLVGPLPPPSGGMANQTRQLAALLRGEGAAVEIVQVNAPYRPAWAGRIRAARALFRLVPYLLSVWRAAGRAQLFHVMANSGWSWHLCAAPAIWLASWRGVPVVVNYRGGEAEAFFRRSFRWVRGSLSRVAAVIVPSGFLAEVFQRRGVATFVVPNIVDLDLFAARRAAPGGATDPPHIVVARNLEEIYDIPTALRAFAAVHARYPRSRLTIAGSGPERARLEALAHELRVAEAVTFTGRVDNARMAEIYRSAFLMLNPSLADNMPISILEALASGLPVVSTRVGGVPYLVADGETALLVPAGDHAAMAAAMVRLIEHPQLAQRLSAAGARHVQQYTWPRVRERLCGVYGDALAAAEGGR